MSQFATRTLAQKVDLDFVLAAAGQADQWQNPSFAGWVFELEVLVCLRTLLTVQQCLDGVSGSCVWRGLSDGSRLHSFKDATDLSQMNLNDGDWLVPSRWNQGSYDLAQLMTNELRLVQVTCAKRKKALKVKYILQLVRALIGRGRVVNTVHVCYLLRMALCFCSSNCLMDSCICMPACVSKRYRLRR